MGNKIDLFTEEQISGNEVKSWAEEIGAIYHNTSAKSGIGVQELFEDISLKILELKSNNKAPVDKGNESKTIKIGQTNNQNNNDNNVGGCCSKKKK